jgi:hypothetical protein
MSSAPVIEHSISCKCTQCGKEIVNIKTTDEEKAKEAFAKSLTAGELHDCKSEPK